MNILAEIAERTRLRVAEEQKKLPLATLRRRAESFAAQPSDFPFEQALKGDDISFICEAKKASPSKGLIAPEFPYLTIAKEYESAGAAAISCLTEPFWFQGNDRYLEEIASMVSIPVLRKDFVVNEYMVYGAKSLGASAVLLICAILDDEELKDYLELSHELGISALVEAHTEKEVERALKAKARIIGANNRDLRTFTVDLDVSRRLRALAPPEILFVSESGIKTRKDIQRLEEIGVNGVLIGETLMRTENKKAMLDELRGR